MLFLYALQRLQGGLPGNPNGMDGVPAPLSFNTAVSFVTNTNWQNYSGESTMSFLTQAAGLAVQNFMSAAVGLTVVIALIRGLVRRKRSTLGNFWVDLTRGVLRILLPLAFLAAIVLASQGVVQNLNADKAVTTVEGTEQVIPGGPVASQESIKELGTNGGGFFNANSAHPFENPNGFTNMFEMWMILVIPISLPFAFGRMAKDRRQGLAVLAAMMALWLVGSLRGDAVRGQRQPQPHLARREPVDHEHPTGREHGGQGDPLRSRGERPVRQHHHGHLDRCGELRPRQLHRRSAARCHSCRSCSARSRRVVWDRASTAC